MIELTMTMRAAESINRRTEQAEATHCLHCGKPLSMFRKMKDNRFCGDEHQRSWHLQRLTRALAHD